VLNATLARLAQVEGELDCVRKRAADGGRAEAARQDALESALAAKKAADARAASLASSWALSA
jgi:hypothetical protein